MQIFFGTVDFLLNAKKKNTMPTYKSTASSSSNYKHPNNNQSKHVQMQMINSPPPSLNRQRRTQSTGSPEYQQYQRKERRGPLHLSQSPEDWDRDSNSNSNTNSSVHSSRKGSSLVPIWALHSSVDTNKRIDHSTKATGVSTSEPLKKKSPILNNSAMGSTGMMASRRNPNAISQYSGGTKFWIRSGNKWIITKNGNGNIHGENTSNAGSMNVSTGTSSGGAGGGKIHPTAVSSYGTNFFNEQSVQKINSISQRRISPSRTNNAHVRNNSGNGNHMTQTYDAASAISSFASSSMAGLYTRQRMTKTPGGFPYLPALHLMKKNENGGNEHNNINGNGSGGGSGGLGISSGTGIARSGMGGGGIMYGVNDQAHGGRFQRSYLLNAKPISSPISNKGIFSEDDEHEIGNSGGGIESMYRSPQNAIDTEDHRLVETRSGVPSGLQRQTSSGYDSEREERLREWKEQFVQKFIENPSGASPRDNGRSLMSSTTIIRRTKSLDSDCDSECHTNQMRLMEWKEEQYKRSAKLKYSKGSVGAGSYLRPPVKQQSQGFSFSFANPVALRADNLSPSMQSSFSSNYDERLNEWKEEQYASFGSNRNVDNDNEEYDSDSTRKQRVKEWKRQFAHVDAPLPKGMESAELSVPPSRVQRYSSTNVETGAVNVNRNHHTQDGGQSLDTIQSAVIRKSRRSRKVPGGGIFPITSPPRRNHIPTNEEIGINSPRKYDELGIFVDSQGVSLPPLTPTRHAQSSDQSLTPRIVNGAQVVEQGDNAMVQPGIDSPMHVNIAEEEESNVVKAAKFLLSLSPQSMSGDGLVSPTGECLLSTALDMGSPCEVIPSLSADMETKQTDRRFQQQESKGLLNAVWGEIGPQPVVGGGYAPTVNTTFKMLDPSVIESPIPTWDNCLFVKAEGARSGRIFLTHTDLIFIYEDDLSDSMLARYGWHREQIDALLLEIDVSSSRAATPVNVPLDASGEGGGVELIGSDNGTVNFMDLLEDCFEKSNDPESPTNANEEGNLVDKMEASECGECNNSSMASSLTPNNALNTCINVQTNSNEAKYAGDGRSTSPLTVDDRRRHHYLDDLPPISLSSSSLDSLVDYEQSNCRDSNEDAVNHCIISAINEEAHMRLQEDERTASFSAAVDRADTSNNKTGTDQDYTTLYGNHTNISSFSEIDMEIDPDQESSLYISGELDTKRKYIGMKCPLSKLAEIFDRRYMMKEVGVEIFAPSPSQLTTSSIRQATTASASTVGGNLTDEIDVQLGPLSHHSIFLVIPGFHGKNVSRFRRKEVPRRDTFVEALKGRTNRLNDAHWQGSPRLQRKWHWRRNDKTYPLSALTRAWRKGHISNFDYLLRLNAIAGRTFHDPGNYPVMPWVLSNYTSTSVPDLSDERNFRDLSKPMGALCPKRLRKFQEKYAGLCACLDTAIPPFMYGSHYSNTGGVVLHYLVRVRPFAGLHRQLQVRNLF